MDTGEINIALENLETAVSGCVNELGQFDSALAVRYSAAVIVLAFAVRMGEMLSLLITAGEYTPSEVKQLFAIVEHATTVSHVDAASMLDVAILQNSAGKGHA